MSVGEQTLGGLSGPGILDRERIIAKPGFNRWLVPPAALAIHLCIGMAYGFSVFWLPLSRALGGEAAAACADMSLLTALFTTSCDWRVADLGWIYTLFFVLLGCSAAIWGGWLERVGPRKAGFVSALCWCGGMVIAAFGVMTHQLWLMWIGAGFIGGIGLGLGYISPVSTLIKWFPDRRGMATGMAIMGFGGGAMIGAPLADLLMEHFKTPDSIGVWQTFLVMAAGYFVFMMGGAFGYRIPPAGWKPEGWVAPQTKKAMITTRHVHLRDAHKTPQFWLIWVVLCLNVSAGIGVIGMASPMLQEIFGGKLIGEAGLSFTQLDAGQKTAIAAIAAGFTGLISLFNIGGRFFWASLSDRIGRKTTYYTFFALGIAMYMLLPTAAHMGSVTLFVVMVCVILSMYGGGFATVPAYLADIFGTQFVGAIHGRLLTAWATAGIVGPVVVNYIREFQIAAGVPRAQVYDYTMYILAGMLALGLIANLFIKPLGDKWFMSEAEVAKLQAATKAADSGLSGSFGIGKGGLDAKAALAWAAVGIPILWGVWTTFEKSLILFR
ncbi:OFA family MFS transporter [Pseudochrobactrum sp. sp1633]|uniref:OFA family MFS transporter n=1 Tax=Pseudochrobactrum sp. sp1633 TaxID=3036706 RepID=UPI0025A53831|nr:OFA family MFS transporter [Pseudochrobactrum sp. sp1633]MDM8346092.1 OFA family MFS transporter [Pseudochrobactrum sp. sp1633]HWD13912.1 OFA family MFS transporter [Pseudochrobactrum sp.]